MLLEEIEHTDIDQRKDEGRIEISENADFHFVYGLVD